MKVVNLISILSAYKSLSPDLLESYLKYHAVKTKTDELNDLNVLVTHLQTISTNANLYDKYYVGYTIPQISKEFDLLRIGNETIINIELKKNSTPEKIKTQLLRNKYYLSFLKKETFVFCYLANERKAYAIDSNQDLIEVHLRELISVLIPQTLSTKADIDSYFNPSNYLVSPFNSTDDFVRAKYFLTNRQEEIKSEILDSLNSSKYSILSIKGKAGTGKTLLTYDIARLVMQKKEVLIVHCGYLNVGHNKLRDDYGWHILAVKYIMQEDLSKYHLVIIDEAQRIYENQLNHVISETKRISNNCIFSYDEQQTLRKGEIDSKIAEKIESELTHEPFELTTKIRTNKEVASFIYCLFGKNRALDNIKKSNIELYYFEDYEETKTFLKHLKSEDWKIINYTPDSRATHEYERHKMQDESDNAHTVIGQEFDNVVAVIDEHFYYKRGVLSTRNYTSHPYYHPTKMLFQIVSRTRIKLCVVVIKNSEVFQRCLEILNFQT